MIWNTWSDFFAMGGYALYVWGSVIVVFASLGIEMLTLRARRTSILVRHRRWLRNAQKDGNENKA